jgi:hypothetical protein
VAFKIPYVYNYITKYAGKSEVIENYLNSNVRGISIREAMHRKYKKLKLGGGQVYDGSGD